MDSFLFTESKLRCHPCLKKTEKEKCGGGSAGTHMYLFYVVMHEIYPESEPLVSGHWDVTSIGPRLRAAWASDADHNALRRHIQLQLWWAERCCTNKCFGKHLDFKTMSIL